MILRGVDYSEIDINSAVEISAFLEKLIKDTILPRGFDASVLRFGEMLVTDGRMLQVGDVPVVVEVTESVLCYPEDSCSGVATSVLQEAVDASSAIDTQVNDGIVTESIQSQASDQQITAFDGFSGITSSVLSDPSIIVTFRSPAPSDAPSMSPSVSAQPSSDPSWKPSKQPSSEPSSVPSSDPSSEPSSLPSCSPSSAPTESPSKATGVNLFYPLWTTGNQGCRNDGDEPDYMALDPTQWLSSSMSACCKKFFGGHMYDSCVGRYPPDHDDCNVMLYYPDWNGNNKGCVDDGQEPYYMLSNHQYFLSNTREECCKKFYEWDLYTCTGTIPDLTHGEYYPDWSGGSSNPTCLKDNKMPTYMLNNQVWYLSKTLRKCCERHFFWDINKCLGNEAVGSDKWYVKYSANTCVQDCVGASPCGGIAESWDEVFSDKKSCCEKKLWWDNRFRTRSG